MQRINHRDLLLGAIFALIGAGFVIAARGLDMGTTQRMGPGLFPLILASVLMLLGIAIAAQSFFTPEEAIGKVPWRGLVLILAAPVLFGSGSSMSREMAPSSLKLFLFLHPNCC